MTPPTTPTPTAIASARARLAALAAGGAVALVAAGGAVALVAACGGTPASQQSPVAATPPTPSERMLGMLPQGAQVVVELDLARLRANPVVGAVVTQAFAGGVAALPAGIPAPPLAEAQQVVLAAYGVGTAQAATLTVLAAPHDIAGTTKVADGFYAVGPADWVEQVQQRVALATTGDAAFAVSAPPELLALRNHAAPPGAPGASLRVTARLPFDARVALARQTGLDAAPAQVSAWADVADDLALVLDCDATDPGDQAADPRHPSDAPRRLLATLRGALAVVSEQPMVRALGLPASLESARLIARGSWVRAIVAIGPSHLQRVADRAAMLLHDAAPDPAAPAPAAPAPAAPAPIAPAPAAPAPAAPTPAGSARPTSPAAAPPRGEPAP